MAQDFKRYLAVNGNELLLLVSNDRDSRYRTVRLYDLKPGDGVKPITETQGEYAGAFVTSFYVSALIKQLSPAEKEYSAKKLFNDPAAIVSWLHGMQKS